ncbi:unnamed protein product, partial [Mesorhabditis belari]|uniref:Uncharacterized protein n=1 Tax=Mesorhabditis belari TaxID=2138241 RepID=A0AAF3J7G4_9BILA
MEPVLITEVQLLVDRFLGKKWKDYIAAVFESSAYGCARLELFASEAKLRTVEPAKVLLLAECVSIRTAFAEKDIRVIKMHMKDNASLTITSKEFSLLRDTLSKATFPHKYVTIHPSSSSSIDSPSTPLSLEDLFDKIPILLLPTTMSRTKRWRDGNYDLHFSESSLNLEAGGTIMDSWDYGSILWVATGERCLGFEVESAGIIECACAAPQLAVDNFRKFVKFSSIFRPVQKRTLNTYNRNYTPLREEAPLSKAPIAEDEEEYSEVADSRASTNRTKDSGVSVGEAKEQPASISRTISRSMQELAAKEKIEEKKTFMKFFRRNSAKQRPDKGREAFEQNASNEWLHVSSKSKITPEQAQGTVGTIFRAEMENAGNRNRTRTNGKDTLGSSAFDFSLLDQELAKQFGHLNPSERSSVA